MRDGHYKCSIQEGYVLLEYGDRFPGDDLPAQHAAVAAVDMALAVSGARAALFDTRPILDTVSEASREICWKWAAQRRYHDRVALVATSQMIQIQANMTARSTRTTVRAFPSIELARDWLRSPMNEPR